MKTIEVPKVTKPSWSDGAFTIAFVYSNKGMRSYWSCSNDGVYIREPNLRSHPEDGWGYKHHFQVIKFDKNSNKKEFKLKRLPKRYIAEIFENVL